MQVLGLFVGKQRSDIIIVQVDDKMYLLNRYLTDKMKL